MESRFYAVALLSFVSSGSCTFDTGNNMSDTFQLPDAMVVPDATPPCMSFSAEVLVSKPSLELVEGGEIGTYDVVLASSPCANVQISIASGGNLEVENPNLVFTETSWNQVRTVRVLAIHDFNKEGSHSSELIHEVTSSDLAYDGLALQNIAVTIADRAHLVHISVALGNQAAEDHSTDSAVSDTGRYVAFASMADNLIQLDTGSKRDIFLRDVELRLTTRVSENMGNDGDDHSDRPRISSDGQVVAYYSDARNLSTATPTSNGEIFSYELATRTNTQVSFCTNCSLEEIRSSVVAISGDGNSVAYSTRRRIVTNEVENEHDVYVVQAGVTTQASLNSMGELGTQKGLGYNAFGETLSASGRYVGFRSAAGNLVSPETGDINFHSYRKDLSDSSLIRISLHSGGVEPCTGRTNGSPSGSPHMSANGNVAAFESKCPFRIFGGGQATDRRTDIYIRNIADQTTTRVTVPNTGANADGDSRMVGISDDGNFVAFTSVAKNLVLGDTNSGRDLFVRDIANGTTIRVSYDEQYRELTDGITDDRVGMSRNGQYFVFSSRDKILASDDNTKDDIYRVQVR